MYVGQVPKNVVLKKLLFSIPLVCQKTSIEMYAFSQSKWEVLISRCMLTGIASTRLGGLDSSRRIRLKHFKFKVPP